MSRSTSRGHVGSLASAALAGLAIVSACVNEKDLSTAACITVCGGVCTDTHSDPRNCGVCGTACAAGQACTDGRCDTALACNGGTTPCGSACVETAIDPKNCGACGNVCGPTQACSAGACTCASSSSPDTCGAGAAAVCTNLRSDPKNCGACGASCEGGASCVAGKCTSGPALSLLAGQLGSWGNLNGVGTAARFQGPWGVCWDGGANLYVTDAGNCVIRKVVIASGETTTVAGRMGSCDFKDGDGDIARFNRPTACVVDKSGNLFIVDNRNCVIRQMVISTATVSTLSGASGSCEYADGAHDVARFRYPEGITYDGNNSLFVGDTANHAIRQVAVADGSVSTLAGSLPPNAVADSTNGTGGAARFRNPSGLAMDGSGFLYVADNGNHTLRQIDVGSKNVITVVGSAGSAGTGNGIGTEALLRYPVGVAFDGTGSLFVTEDGNHDVRRVTLPDFAVSTPAGASGTAGYANGTGPAGLFNEPLGIAFDKSGNYYVADQTNNAVRNVTANGTVGTLAGLGAAFGSANGPGASATFDYPWGLAFDGEGTLYLSDYNSNAIRSVNLTTGEVATLAGAPGQSGNVDGIGASARFNHPTGIVLDGHGNLYVADQGSNTIRQVVLSTALVKTIAGSPGGGGYQEGIGTGILFSGPNAVAFDGGNPGNLYITDAGNDLVRHLSLTTFESKLVAGATKQSDVVDGIGAGARFANLTGIGANGHGKLYVADANRIRLVDAATGRVSTLTGSGGYSEGQGAYANFSFNGNPAQITVDAAGDVLLADFNNQVIRKLSTSTMTTSPILGIFGEFGGILGPMPTSITTSPRAVVPIPGGYAFIANYGVFVVR